jgi:hypothetical protein
MEWIPNDYGAGPGIPCTDPGAQAQNVPAPGDDLTLEVTMIYPMTVPLVNRVVFGVFVNFSSMAQERLNLGQIVGPGGADDVMVYPTRLLARIDRNVQFRLFLMRVFQEFGYSSAAVTNVGLIADGLADRGWFPLPVRARCTLTTEGAMFRMSGPPGARAW